MNPIKYLVTSLSKVHKVGETRMDHNLPSCNSSMLTHFIKKSRLKFN